MIVLAAVVVAVACWVALFVPPRGGFWRRSLVVAPAVAVAATVLAALADPSPRWFEPVELSDLVAGVLVAVAAYGAVRVGYPLGQRWVPRLTAYADRLLALRTGAPAWLVAAGAALTGVGEELLFRGVIQARGGFVVGLAVYAGVQLAARNPVLVALGVVGAAVWGGLYALSGTLLPGLIAHVLPVAAIALWPPADARRRFPLAHGPT